jgi:hypothetical protein
MIPDVRTSQVDGIAYEGRGNKITSERPSIARLSSGMASTCTAYATSLPQIEAMR